MPRFKANHGIWIYVYALIVAIFSAIALQNFIGLRKHFRRATVAMTTGITIFVTGAVFLEIISYQFLRNDVSSL